MGFKRTIENFTCGNCGFFVRGDGFTNHCSNCLWSKHVDIDPGDREEPCGGMMEPVEARLKQGKWSVEHICTKCGFRRRAFAKKEDNVEGVLEIARENNPSSLR
ncbi:MAG: hypothetical protein A2653_02610 [Candidatus Zambryskibacteria bacterium RIFCSPHIGHO2_01_FULL_43_25]|uniref:RNHCP domain-containing protein n=1 Tax=Candidatus Zambryskibacteria bacterium RIFCSPLOWO2_01_FULL_45_21 TaxID=1802761 RepID=A0A1G2U5K2_9BACT|nr:MAG: hypothetical protein A2653_02610 [Candidatus Zambryskibacteria bacterium RIFCSPHIGHO2_01_FULL_43_25]OHB04747.1 MAG: hypothetical protein A3B14_03760 [Candidatus Zambryskibacteria bacterium RIFCSPLOWO2_01_FULL_45_21]